MTKTVLVVGNAAGLANALTRAEIAYPDVAIKVVGSEVFDRDGVSTFIDGMSEDEKDFYLQHEVMYLGNYRLDERKRDLDLVHVEPYDDLPANTTKPKFLMQRDHHIRSPRGRR